MHLNELQCSHCQGAGLELAGENQAVCRDCGTNNSVDGALCPQCEFVNPAGAETCQDCRLAVRRKCANCGVTNWSAAEQCSACKAPLDSTTRLGNRWLTSTAGRLDIQHGQAHALKEQEAADSRRRQTELEDIEIRRQAGLAEARTRRDAQQRGMAWGLGLLVLGFAVVVAFGIFVTYFVH